MGRMREFEERLDRSGERLVYVVDDILAERASALREAGRRIALVVKFFLQRTGQGFSGIVSDFKNNAAKNIAGKEFFLRQIPVNLSSAVQACLKGHLNALDRQQDRTEMMNPLQVLKRGYSITFHNGKVVKNAGDIHSGDRLTTRLHKGTVDSTADK